jgi:hypothetical protein
MKAPAASKQSTLPFGLKAKAIDDGSKEPHSDGTSFSLGDASNAPPPPLSGSAPTLIVSDSAPLPAGPAPKRPQAPKLTLESNREDVISFFTWRSKHGGVDPVPFEWTVEVVNTLMPLVGGPPVSKHELRACVGCNAVFSVPLVCARGLILDSFACFAVLLSP